jgi:hypothetical protein
MDAAQQLGPNSATEIDAERFEQQAGVSPAPVREIAAQQPPLAKVVETVGLAIAVPARGLRTANELAAMILADLSRLEGCPKQGVKVTVYGCNPWNCWLSFAPAAGPVRNKTEIQNFCQIITERLKRLYEISD